MPDAATVSVRPERPSDDAAVREINERAFGQAAEADLVDILRRTAEPFCSLVAAVEGRLVGHIFFSPVETDTAGSGLIMGLAPMAVLPERQRQGVGSALVREGLRTMERMGASAVVVLGHPDYYPRFGFTPASRYGLSSEFDVPDEAFMALELEPGALEGAYGTVRYLPAFGDI